MRTALLFTATSALGCQLVLSFADPPSLREGDAGPAPFADASATNDAAPPGIGCARFVDARFCADFEGADPLDAQTWPRQERDAATVMLLPGDGFEGTMGLRFALDAMAPAGGCNFTWVGRQVATSFSRITAQAMIRAKRPSGGMLVWQVRTAENALYLVAGSLKNDITIELVSQIVDSKGVGTTVEQRERALETSPVGRWERVSLSVDVGARRATLAYGAVEIMVPIVQGFPTADPLLTVGPWCSRMPAEWDVDDVVVHVEP